MAMDRRHRRKESHSRGFKSRFESRNAWKEHIRKKCMKQVKDNREEFLNSLRGRTRPEMEASMRAVISGQINSTMLGMDIEEEKKEEWEMDLTEDDYITLVGDMEAELKWYEELLKLDERDVRLQLASTNSQIAKFNWTQTHVDEQEMMPCLFCDHGYIYILDSQMGCNSCGSWIFLPDGVNVVDVRAAVADIMEKHFNFGCMQKPIFAILDVDPSPCQGVFLLCQACQSSVRFI